MIYYTRATDYIHPSDKVILALAFILATKRRFLLKAY